jgi:RNA polymerase primary sigma factor
VSNAKSFVSREKSWAAKSEELLERIQAGNEGLLVGVDGFDNDLGFKFSTYATHWIKQRQGRDQYESGQSLQRKVSSQTLVNQVRRSLEKFSREYHREPDEYDLAEFSGIPVEKVRLGLRLMRSNISLDAEMGARDKDSRMTLGDMLAAREEESAASVLDREWVRKLTHPDAKILEERESLVVRLRFGIFSDEERTAMSQQYGVDLREPLTLQQVGRILGVTRERIRQIESRAIGKLRDVLERRGDLS